MLLVKEEHDWDEREKKLSENGLRGARPIQRLTKGRRVDDVGVGRESREKGPKVNCREERER